MNKCVKGLAPLLCYLVTTGAAYALTGSVTLVEPSHWSGYQFTGSSLVAPVMVQEGEKKQNGDPNGPVMDYCDVEWFGTESVRDTTAVKATGPGGWAVDAISDTGLTKSWYNESDAWSQCDLTAHPGMVSQRFEVQNYNTGVPSHGLGGGQGDTFYIGVHANLAVDHPGYIAGLTFVSDTNGVFTQGEWVGDHYVLTGHVTPYGSGGSDEIRMDLYEQDLGRVWGITAVDEAMGQWTHNDWTGNDEHNTATFWYSTQGAIIGSPEKPTTVSLNGSSWGTYTLPPGVITFNGAAYAYTGGQVTVVAPTCVASAPSQVVLPETSGVQLGVDAEFAVTCDATMSDAAPSQNSPPASGALRAGFYAAGATVNHIHSGDGTYAMYDLTTAEGDIGPYVWVALSTDTEHPVGLIAMSEAGSRGADAALSVTANEKHVVADRVMYSTRGSSVPGAYSGQFVFSVYYD